MVSLGNHQALSNTMLIILLSVLIFDIENNAASPPPSLPEVINAWESVEADTKSVRARIDQSKIIFKAAFLSDERKPDGSTVDKPYPDEDTEVRNQLLVIYDRSRIRWEATGTDVGPQGKLKQSQKIAFDGRETTSLNLSTTPFAQIHDELSQGKTAKRNAGVRPLLFALFPATVSKEYVDLGSTVSIKNAIDDDDAIVVESLSKKRLHHSTEIWVDRKFGMRIVRVLEYINAKPVIDIRIEYELDGKQNVVPVRWESTLYFPRSGRPRRTSKATVQALEFNPELQPGTFRIEIPKDAYVYDFKNSTDYIHQANGALREITHSELMRGATYEDLLNSESGKAKLEGQLGKMSASSLFFIFINLVVVGVLARIIWLRRGRDITRSCG